jgi:hypothetical protein
MVMTITGYYDLLMLNLIKVATFIFCYSLILILLWTWYVKFEDVIGGNQKSYIVVAQTIQWVKEGRNGRQNTTQKT